MDKKERLKKVIKIIFIVVVAIILTMMFLLEGYYLFVHKNTFFNVTKKKETETIIKYQECSIDPYLYSHSSPVNYIPWDEEPEDSKELDDSKEPEDFWEKIMFNLESFHKEIYESLTGEKDNPKYRESCDHLTGEKYKPKCAEGKMLINPGVCVPAIK